MSRKAYTALALLLVSCAAPSTDPAAERRVVRELCAGDSTEAVLADVEDALAEDAPVRAAELVAIAAIANQRLLTDVEGFAPQTSDGRRTRSQAIRVLRARAAALDAYRTALAGGVLADDHEVYEATRELRLAQQSMSRFVSEL